MRDAKAAPSAFQVMGGRSAVERLVEAFYRNMDTFEEARSIRAMHAADLTQTKKVLVQYFGEWLGGPKEYSTERGHPRLRMRHMRFSIGPFERDAWMACMNAALDEQVTDPALREQLRSSLAKLADWMRNDLDGGQASPS
jgi:hemoglobin